MFFQWSSRICFILDKNSLNNMTIIPKWINWFKNFLILWLYGFNHQWKNWKISLMIYILIIWYAIQCIGPYSSSCMLSISHYRENDFCNRGFCCHTQQNFWSLTASSNGQYHKTGISFWYQPKLFYIFISLIFLFDATLNYVELAASISTYSL